MISMQTSRPKTISGTNDDDTDDYRFDVNHNHDISNIPNTHLTISPSTE